MSHWLQFQIGYKHLEEKVKLGKGVLKHLFTSYPRKITIE
jgi:hypothetical protein